MLSLSSLAPRDVHTLWYSPSYLPSTTPIDLFPIPPPAAGSTHTAPPPRKRRDDSNIAPSPLTLLLAEEAAITARKANIRKFGATWIRPPGIAKTYQAMVDEAAERAEQEVLARREMEMAAMRAAMEREEEAARQRGAGWVTDGNDPVVAEGEAVGVAGMEMERDLDEEVPEADGMTFDLDAEDEGEGEQEEEGEEEGEGETSLLEDTETAESDNDLDVDPSFNADTHEDEQNLDDEIPEAEAGSYEHTDTEVEDESSIIPSSASHPDSSSPPPPPPQSQRVQQQQQQHLQHTFSTSPSVFEFNEQTDLQDPQFTSHHHHHHHPVQSPRGGDLRYSLRHSLINGTPSSTLGMDGEGESSLFVSSPIAARGGGGSGPRRTLFSPSSWGRARRRGNGQGDSPDVR